MQKALILTVLDFRRIEFLYEGIRYWDVLRWNIPVTHTTIDGATSTLTPDDDRRILQIPQIATASGIQLNDMVNIPIRGNSKAENTMKTLRHIQFCLFALLAGAAFTACNEEDPIDPNADIPGLGGEETVQTETDRWLYENYVVPFNIDVEYKWGRHGHDAFDRQAVSARR